MSSTLASTVATIPPIDTGVNNPTSPSQPGGPSHEVLANFFQSLLSKKASSGGSSPTTASLLSGTRGDDAVGGTSATATPNSTLATNPLSSTPSSGTTRRPTVSRKDVHKELDRMRQYVNKQ